MEAYPKKIAGPPLRTQREGSVRPAYSTGSKAKLTAPASLVFHSQVVSHRKYSGDALGLHLGDLFIHLSGDHALERDMAVLENKYRPR